MITYRIADTRDLEAISRLCADAFIEYDFYRPFVKDPKKRWDFVYDLHVQCFKSEIRRSQAVVGAEIRGKCPDRHAVTLRQCGGDILQAGEIARHQNEMMAAPGKAVGIDCADPG